MLEVHLLGQFDVRQDGEAIEIPSRPAQSLFAYLILSAGTPHRREMLAGLLWPEANESNARSNLRHALWRLRKAVGEKYLEADKISIGFRRETDYWLDAAELEREMGAEAETDELLQVLSSCGGELLPGFYDDWVVLERERLRAAFEQRMQILLDHLIAERRWTEVSQWAERWIALGQVPEPAYRALMVAACALGDTAGVASAYQRCREALGAELGVEPSPNTHRTYERLLEGGSQAALEQAGVTPSPGSGAEAVSAMLERWREEESGALDLSTFAIVRAFPGQLSFTQEDAHLLVQSVVEHGLEIEAWLMGACAPEDIAEALMACYEAYPKPRVRARIVAELASLDLDRADQGLLRIAKSDDAPSVRAVAAVETARRGHRGEIVEVLLSEVGRGEDAAAMAALVELADTVGLPEGQGPYPRGHLALALVQRRFGDRRREIVSQVGRAALGGGLAMSLVATLQLLPTALLNPAAYQETVAFIPLPMWLFSNALLGMLWGGAQGAATGLMVGLSDALWRVDSARRRLGFGALAGLTHTFFLVLLTLIGGFSPEVGPGVYAPVNLVYGLIAGAALSLVVPPLAISRISGLPWRRIFYAVAAIALAALVRVYLIYPARVQSAMVLDLLFALLFPVGLAFALRRGARGVKRIAEE